MKATMKRLLPLLAGSLLSCLTASAATLHVWQGSPSNAPPYTNWATAAHTIQDAVDAANAGDTVLVTNGVYSAGHRETFDSYGNSLGFSRVAIPAAISLCSVNGPALTVVAGGFAIRCCWLANNAVLSGFTLTSGRTFDSGAGQSMCGGGAWCDISAVVTNCILSNNATDQDYYGDGGGVYSGRLDNCALVGNSARFGGGALESTLNNCTLSGNWAYDSGGGTDGGTLNNCTLSSNWAYMCGGGAAYATLNNCTLTGNSADGYFYGGGAAYDSTLSNCVLSGNSAFYLGGGAVWGTLNNCSLTGNSAEYGGGACFATLDNCTLTGNSAYNGGGAAAATLNNCITFFNTAANGPNYDSFSILSYCCTTPLPMTGSGNISGDPQLADSFHLTATSPCRGRGSVAYAMGTDLAGQPWANPPSIGCDEYWPGANIGPLHVAILASYTNVASGLPIGFTAHIVGPASASVWDFGHGIVLSNQPFVVHTWTAPGDYVVVLTAYNDAYAEGVRVVQTVHIVPPLLYCVAADCTNPTAPYSSWETAATNIQDAVDAATPGDTVMVTNGVYSWGGRAVNGSLNNRVAVDKPITLQSVNGPQFTVIDGGGIARCVSLTDGASLSGFTLTNGAAGGWVSSDQCGGGIYCGMSDVTVSNCVLTSNSAVYGGGVYRGLLNNCTVTRNSTTGYWASGGGAYDSRLNNCVVESNSAAFGGGAWGSTLTTCTLTGNSASQNGGGTSQSVLEGCTVRGNAAWWAGGADGGSLSNCVLTGNSSGYCGGGAGESELYNCTVVDNLASASGGGAARSTFRNCIIAYNAASGEDNYTTDSTLDYCCTTPRPATGSGNITNEPLFVDRLNGNLRLQSNSPCVNAGNNSYVTITTDLDGNARIVRGTVDIGAYEYQGAGSVVSYAWLQQYGLPTDGSADYTDADHDGQNNWQEWQADTNPTNAASSLRLTILSNSPPVAFTFASSAARLYTLQCCTNLTPRSVWTPVPGQTDISGSGDMLLLSDTNPPAPAFYRVSVRFP